MLLLLAFPYVTPTVVKIIGEADKLESKGRVVGGLGTVIQVELIFDF